jgi:hypothetical protein
VDIAVALSIFTSAMLGFRLISQLNRGRTLSRCRGVESLRLLLWRRGAVALPRGRVALRNLGTHGILVISRRRRVRHGGLQ